MTTTLSSALAITTQGTASASTITAQDLIDAARLRHWSFTDIAVGDGAALLFLNQRQRTQLAAHGAQIEGLVGTAMQVPVATINGVLVALVDGLPTYTSSYEDGWPVHVTVDGVPYFDPGEAPIATDPFGLNGGVPGFPLPTDMVRLIAVALSYGTDARLVPCDVITERERFSRPGGRNPSVFISANRLVPVLPNASHNTGDRWFRVSAVQISYVAVQTLRALTDVVQLPAVLCEALTADLAAWFAMQSERCPDARVKLFVLEAEAAAEKVKNASLDLLDSVQQSSVIFRG